ncbi:MBL fold metallo-hydrolase [Armatimonas sp.]|uniref:MBL fold metallo-hydrolase n=1 Tax=Armatimonas sp. TaxID=1872638 RepID=UPI00286A80AE|nr:MBL fold metallo-hydrolase [Armatimonas sp.]
MIVPFLKDAAFLADVDAACASQPEALHLWWLGQSGYLVIHGQTRLLLDPYLSDSLTEKYAATDKPHTRLTERVIAPELLTQISLITSSHNHTDHLDAETLLPIFATNPEAVLVLPEANTKFASERLGWQTDDLRLRDVEVGNTVKHSGVYVTAVPAAHEDLLPCYAGFIIAIGPWALYHSGDTIPYEGMEALLALYSPTLALLPINGRLPERHVSGNLWGDEAATLAKAIGAKLAIPGHYEMFSFNTESPELFIATCERLGQPYRVLRAGERLTLN